MKKKLLIVTANDFLVYQPTILNLYDFLQIHFDITIVSFEPEFVGKQKDLTRNIIYLKIPFRKTVQDVDYAVSLVLKSVRKIAGPVNYDYPISKKNQMLVLERFLRKTQSDIVLSVDMVALYLSQKIYPSCHFISLEIYEDDPYRNKIDINRITSVVIQNQMRYDYLFGNTKLKTFFIQNAPVFKEEHITHYERRDFIWAGSIVKRFAVFECLDFMKEYSQYKIVLKGGGEKKTLMLIRGQYKQLIEDGNLKIDQGYLASDAFIDYLSKFRIGFCFYEWELINSSINYQTAPSGKLFMYLAAGVPVIACNIPGFQFVREFNAGVLIDDYKPSTIKSAIDKIESSYAEFQKGCYDTARYFSFDRSVAPFANYLLDISH